MSSRSKRSTPSAPDQSTPVTSPRGARSPSPTMVSRVQEKAALANLNDRLATYIDRARQLEADNSRLVRQVQSQEEVVTREVSNIKALYESELNDARALLDETAKEKAKLQIDVSKYRAELADLHEKYNIKDRDLQNAEKRLLGADAQVNDLQARLNDVITQRKHWETEFHRMKKEAETLEKQLAIAKKQLEDETLLRVDLENRVQSLTEELTFKGQVHAQELNETRSRTTIEIEEVDGRLQADYESRLAEALKQIREDNDYQIRTSREETENFFAKKLAELKHLAMAKDNLAENARTELRNLRVRMEEVSSELAQLRAQNARYENQVGALEAQLANERAENAEMLAARNKELEHLRSLLEDQVNEYRDLLDVKVQLDMEIAAYRKLVEGEEYRLNISTEGTPGKTPLTGGARKRKRVGASLAGSSGFSRLSRAVASQDFTSEASASGAVEIVDVDTSGNFIKLKNSSDKDAAIGGWQLKHMAGVEETVFKFHRSVHIKPGQTSTVWSSETETSHAPPTDIVMKGQKWFIADSMKTCLINGQAEEVASRNMARATLRTSYVSGSLDIGEGEYEGEGKEKCVVM